MIKKLWIISWGFGVTVIVTALAPKVYEYCQYHLYLSLAQYPTGWERFYLNIIYSAAPYWFVISGIILGFIICQKEAVKRH
jgi:hypothetical protein